MSQLVQDLSIKLGRIIRYIFPGLLIISTSGLAFPGWFGWLDISNAAHLAVLAVAALLVGNTWYAIHR